MQLLKEEPTVHSGTTSNNNGQPAADGKLVDAKHSGYDGGTDITVAVSDGPGTTRYLYSPERRELTRRMSPGNCRRQRQT